MKPEKRLLVAGGGTGGHVFPGLAVARELRRRGWEVVFVGTRRGLEAELVPAEGFPIEWIEIGGLKRVGLSQTLRSLWQLPRSVLQALTVMKDFKPAAVFSTGGYVAGPAVLAAWWKSIPVVLMEPNAMPGFTNRVMGRFAARALLNFQEAAVHFPKGRSEVTGLPVRAEFFSLPRKSREGPFTVLITGGSRGSRTLNQAARESWPLFSKSGFSIRFLHQTGTEAHSELQREFTAAGLEGKVVPFIGDMPSAFASADLVVCRSGAGAVAELGAAGRPSVLIPFPFAADDHQSRNAEVLARAGAARLVPDREWNGERLFSEVTSMASEPGLLERMGEEARRFARPHSAERAADLLEQLGETQESH